MLKNLFNFGRKKKEEEQRLREAQEAEALLLEERAAESIEEEAIRLAEEAALEDAVRLAEETALEEEVEAESAAREDQGTGEAPEAPEMADSEITVASEAPEDEAKAEAEEEMTAVVEEAEEIGSVEEIAAEPVVSGPDIIEPELEAAAPVSSEFENEGPETVELGTAEAPVQAEEPKEVEPAEAETAPEEAKEVEEAAEEVVEKKGFLQRLKEGLTKTSKSITDRIDNLINNYGEIDDDLFDELEEILITADIGMDTTMEIVDKLKDALVERKVKDPKLVKTVLRDVMIGMLSESNREGLYEDTPLIILVIGVNGAGKTTSIGKIANRYKEEGKSVMLAAADTFRAAAVDQLKMWGDRSGVTVVSHQEGSDPAAVVFDAIQSAKARNTDVLICDTAGRLHNKKNLMNELSKIFRIVAREYGDAKMEVLLVLDATTGQNAIIQAKTFRESADITGLVLTKLDGTAKGGAILSINKELGIPVKLIGVGEGMYDLQDFDATKFVDALLNLDHA